MTTIEEQPPEIKIPNLGGLIRQDDLYYKGKLPYCSWAKTAQRIREHAPNWFFALEPDPNGQTVWIAPDNTGYLMGYFYNIESGIKLPLYPYAITGYGNKTVKYEEITSNDIQNSHRRCLCACGCYSFGDAFELWAGLEIQEAKEEEERTPPPEKTGVAGSLTKPNQKLEPTSVLKGLPDPITKDAKTTILDKLTRLQQSQPEKLKGVVESFRKKFSIKDTKITRHITTAEHGEFLALEISKIDESL